MSAFLPSRTVPSSVDWNALAEKSRALVLALEAEHAHLRANVLFQECGGLIIEKNTVEERITAGAPFPAEFSGSSFVISVTNGERSVEWADNGVSIEALDRGFAALRDDLGDLPPGPEFLEEEAVEGDFEVEVQRPLHEVPVSEKVAMLRKDFEMVRVLAPNARNIDLNYAEALTIEMFVSAKKRMRQQISRVVRGIYVLVPGRDDHSVLARAGRDAQGGFEQASIRASTWNQLKEGLELLPQAEPLAGGEYDVIIDGEWAGMLAHEALGHGAEADLMTKNRSRALHYLGKPVGSSLVNMRESARETGRSGSFFFDHEGTLATSTPVIKDGVLKQPMTHRASAAALKVPASSNGRRQSPLHKTYTRMTNTDFLPGTASFEELVKAVDYGFYLQKPLGGMEDPKGWGIQCRGSLAREIKDGAFTGRCFGPVCVTGDLPELLSSVRMVSKDFESDGMGYCGKGFKEFVKVTFGGPAMLLRARLG